MPFLFFIIMLGIGAALIAGAIRKSLNQTEEAWVGAASRLRLPYHKKKSLGGRRKLEGEYRGYHVKVNTFTNSSGNGNSTFTRYTLFMESLGLGLELTQQHFLSGLSNVFTGGQDLTVGDEDFDKAVIVQSTSPVAMQKFLTPNRRLQIRKFLTGNRRARITDDEISYIHNGVVNDEARIKGGLDVMVQIAQSFHGSTEPAATRTSRTMDDLRENLRTGTKPRPSMAEDMGPSVVAAQAAAAFLDREPLRRSVESLAPEEHSDREAFQRVAPEPAPVDAAEPRAPMDEIAPPEPLADPEPAPAPEPLAPPEPVSEAAFEAPAEPQAEAAPEVMEHSESSEPSPAPDLVDYTSLRAELFESGIMSSESKDVFEKSFAGRSIEWSGKLRRISRFSSDFVFEGAGAKAVVELEGVVDGSFTKGVQAIVQLPESAADEFGSAYDAPITFTGTLHSCDGFLRDILVTAGQMRRAD